jgi:hypothetical protein
MPPVPPLERHFLAAHLAHLPPQMHLVAAHSLLPVEEMRQVVES